MKNSNYLKIDDNSNILEMSSFARSEQIFLTSDLLKLVNEPRCDEYKKANITATHIVSGVLYGGGLKMKIKEVYMSFLKNYVCHVSSK